MRHLLLVLTCLLLPAAATARCVPFDLFASIGQIPYLVHGQVTQSNRAELDPSRCGPAVCQHRFDIRVIEVLKGKTAAQTLQVSYDYVPQRPNISLFAQGDEYIFALAAIADDGTARLWGNTCGRTGTGIEDLTRLKARLERK